jgi:hypothetical protein
MNKGTYTSWVGVSKSSAVAEKTSPQLSLAGVENRACGLVVRPPRRRPLFYDPYFRVSLTLHTLGIMITLRYFRK